MSKVTDISQGKTAKFIPNAIKITTDQDTVRIPMSQSFYSIIVYALIDTNAAAMSLFSTFSRRSCRETEPTRC